MYEQVKNGETIQEGNCEEDYQQTLKNDPDYDRIAEEAYKELAMNSFINAINEPLKAPF